MASQNSSIVIKISIAISLTIGSTAAYLLKDHMAKQERTEIAQQYEVQIRDIKTEQEREKGRLLNEIDGLKDKLDSANKELREKTAELEGKRTEVRSLQEMIDRNPTGADVKDLEKKLGEANGEVARLSTLANSLEEQVTELSTERNALTQKVSELESAVMTLNSELAAIRDENGELRAALIDAEQKANDIKNLLSKTQTDHQNELAMLFQAMSQEFYGDRLKVGVFGKSKKRAQREAYEHAREIYQKLNLRFQNPQVQDAIVRVNNKIKDLS